MEKDKAVKILCEKGLHAYNDRGIVMISLKDSTHTESTIKKLLKEIGYDSSFGIIGKGKSNSSVKKEAFDEQQEEPVEINEIEETDESVDNNTDDSVLTQENSYPTFSDDNEQLTFQW